MMFGNETEILGVFSEKKELIKVYDRLVAEDSRCLGNLLPRRQRKLELSILYKIPLNCFVGRKEE